MSSEKATKCPDMNSEADSINWSENVDENRIKSRTVALMQCPPLNRITLGQHKSDYNNRMIQLTDVFCVLFMYNGMSNI